MAVYSFLSDADVANIAQIYGFAEITQAKPIAEGVENSNYLLTFSDGSNAIFTIFEARVAVAELPYFLKLKQYLHENGYVCPLPIYTKDGDLSFELHGKQAAMVSFLAGKSVLQPDANHVFQAGEWLAKLHKAGEGFAMHRANSEGFVVWQELRQKIAERACTFEHLSWLELIDNELQYQANHQSHHLPSGIIHADFFPNNVFFDDNSQLCGVIDFYFACNDAYAYDLAIVANAWCCNQAGDLQQSQYAALLAGYNQVRLVTQIEVAAMPHLLRAAALRFLLTRLHDVLYPSENAILVPHNPEEYVNKLLHFRGLEKR